MKSIIFFTAIIAFVIAHSVNDFYHINDGNMECVLCNYVVSKTENFLTNNHTQGQIINELDHLCQYLPNSTSTTCVNFVDAYVPQIIDLIDDKFPPELICDKLNLCTNTTI
jgi:saposin